MSEKENNAEGEASCSFINKYLIFKINIYKLAPKVKRSLSEAILNVLN